MIEDNKELIERRIHRNVDDGKEDRLFVYLNGERVKGCFYFCGSDRPNHELYGAIGRFVEPKKIDEKTGTIPMIFEQGMVMWEPMPEEQE